MYTANSMLSHVPECWAHRGSGSAAILLGRTGGDPGTKCAHGPGLARVRTPSTGWAMQSRRPDSQADGGMAISSSLDSQGTQGCSCSGVHPGCILDRKPCQSQSGLHVVQACSPMNRPQVSSTGTFMNGACCDHPGTADCRSSQVPMFHKSEATAMTQRLFPTMPGVCELMAVGPRAELPPCLACVILSTIPSITHAQRPVPWTPST